MAPQVPVELIEQARISLWKEAGLDSSNPTTTDPCFPTPPTVESDCPITRCEHCKGELLRGPRSLLCVYCGRQHNPDSPPGPISFNSTIGFRWLIDSLGLDGSEIIEPSEVGKQNNRGQTSVKDEISLSDFLGLEMKWPGESERFGLTDADELKNHGERPLRLVGVDFTHTFSEEKSENSSNLPVKKTISNEKSIEFEAFTVQGSRAYLENRDFSGGDVKSSEVENGDNFSLWEADFQAASSVAPVSHDYFESSHPSEIPSVDYAPHRNSLFGPLNDFEEGKSSHDSSSHVPHSNEENEPSYRSNSLSGVSVLERKHDVSIIPEHGGQDNSQSEQQIGRSKSADNVKGVGYDSFDSWEDFKGANSIGNDQWVTSSGVVSSSAKISTNDDSSDVWNGFTSSTGSGDNKNVTSSIIAPEVISFDAWNDFSSSGIVSGGQVANRGLNSAEEMSVSNDMFGPWNNVTNLKSAQEVQQNVPGEIAVSSETANQKDEDSFSLSKQNEQPQNTGTLLSADKMNEKDENSFNIWSDSMGSTVAQPNPVEISSVELDGGPLNGGGDENADGWGNFMSLASSQSEEKINSTEIHGDKNIIKEDDSFGSWNDFTSSACKPESNSLNEDTVQAWSDISDANIQPNMVDQQAPQNKAIVEDGDSLNSWGDFRSSSNAVSNNLPSSTDASVNNITSEHFSNQSWNDIMSSNFQPGQEHSMKVSENDTVKDDDMFNSWGSFRNSSVLQSSEAKVSEADDFFNDWSSRLSGSKDTFDNQPEVGGVLVPDTSKTNENYDSSNAWSDFTRSTNLPGNQSVNQKESQANDKQAVTEDDPFDAWSSLMTSSSSLSNSNNFTSHEPANETNLLNSRGNLKIPSFGSTLQPVLFPDAADDRSGSASVGITLSENSDFFRMEDGNAKSSIVAEQSQEDEQPSGQNSGKKPIDAETLISQMHDLSCMLESSLSVPKNVD